jgi:type II secretory pathway component PulM
MTGAIVRGFQMGTSLMQVPFNYFMNAFGERIRDESSDIQSAGGLFAISQRKNLGMFDTFQSAVKTQQDINYRLAQSAAALPGATTAYVQQGKRISDSIMTAMGANAPGMQKFAEELGAKQGDKLDALGVLIQKFTEKAVLLGQGSQYRGAYGVPQLVEMMMNSPRLSEQSFQRFAVYRDMPILQSAFRDMQKDLAKTGAYSKERMRLVFELLDKALPNEVIQAHKNSMAGFLEAFKSAFLDPEVGLFGIGRRMKDIAPQVDQYGKVIEKNGKVVMDSLSLYTLIQQTLTGFGLPLSELATLLPQLYEPFAKIIPDLVNLRNVAQRFYYSFNAYTKGFEEIADTLGLGTTLGRKMKETAGARGALNALSNLLTEFGSLSEGRFQEIANKLKDPNFVDFLGIAKELFGALFNSSVMEQIGQTIGSMVGGTLSELGSLMGGVTGATSTGPFAKGLRQGWDQANGTAGIAAIFRSLFNLIFTVLKEAITKAPIETLTVGALLFAPSLLPALISGGVGALAGRGGGGGRGGGLGGRMSALAGLAPFFTAPGTAALGQSMRRGARRLGTGLYAAGAFGAEAAGLGYNLMGRPGSRVIGGLGRGISAVGRYVPGAAVAAGALEMGTSLASGESFGKAAAGTIGTVLGGVVGSAFGPVGTLIGVTAGSYLGNLFFNLFDPAAIKQRDAAQQQAEAAARQLQAATLRTAVPKTEVPLAVDSQTIAAVLKIVGAPGAMQGAGASAQIIEDTRQRNLALQSYTAAVKELERVKGGLGANVTPGTAQYDRIVKPYQDGVERAAAQLRTRQAEMEKSLQAIPTAMRDALVLKISTMSTQAISSAVADVINASARATEMGRRDRYSSYAAEQIWFQEHPGQYGPAPPAARPRNTSGRPPGNGYAGSLGDAISREMRMKPPGSNLVIANSSETIIPAARGLGMKDFMNTLDTGFNRVAATVAPRSSGGSYGGSGHVTNHISIVQQPGQDAEELAAIVAMRIGEAVAEARSASIFI